MHAFPRTVAAILLASGLTVTAARADDRTPDSVRAEVLFDEARHLMASHDYAAACPRLAQSETLDPAPGTALNLALCYEKEGKLATAWAAYKTAEALADRMGQKDRVAVAKKSAAKLEPTLSQVTVTVPAPSRVPGLEIRFDGEKLDDLEWDAASPRDGGGHDIEATAPGKKPWKTHIDLKDSGAHLSIEVPPLEDAPAPPLPVHALVSSSAPTPLTSFAPNTGADEGANAHPGQTQRIAGIVIGGAGVVALGVAGVLSIVAKSNFNAAEKENGPARVNDSTNAVHMADAATFVVIGGAVAVAAGVVVWFTAPRAAAQVGTNGRELLVAGTF